MKAGKGKHRADVISRLDPLLKKHEQKDRSKH